MLPDKFDVLVVGGGVLGTFHAYHALIRGYTVVLLEKDHEPVGASVRNFGQIIPSGLNSKWQRFGRESLRLYKELQKKMDISVRKTGSIYIASNEEEEQLLTELHKINLDNSYESHLLTKKQSLDHIQGLKGSYCRAGLYFPKEITIDPAKMIFGVKKILIEEFNLCYKNGTTVINLKDHNNSVIATASTGEKFYASKAIICNGSDFSILFPSIFEKSDLVISKLQMLKTVPQNNFKLRSSLLTGWSIRRYSSFKECLSYESIVQNDDPESFQKRNGIHLLFKQALDGSIIFGDSHKYSMVKQTEKLGFQLDMKIDRFLISEAKKIIDLPTFKIDQRWYGLYSQRENGNIFQYDISPNIHIVTGIGSKGMTVSPGFAKEKIKAILT